MQVGDRVTATVDNYGMAGTIVDVREEEPRWLVRADDDWREVWCFTYEVDKR